MSDSEDLVDNREKLCSVCLATDLQDMVEPVTSPCGHLICWPCLYKSAKGVQNRACPVCKQEVHSITPLYGIGGQRTAEHVNIPERPAAGADPFQFMSFSRVRRSSRARTANIRLFDIGDDGAEGGSRQGGRTEALERINRDVAPVAGGEEVAGAVNILETSQSEPVEVRETGPAAIVPRQEENTAEREGVDQILNRIFGPSHSEIQDDLIDFSDDEEQSRREEENSDPLRHSVVPRFKPKQIITGTAVTHLDAIIREVEAVIVAKQMKIKHLNWTEVAHLIRNRHPSSFPTNTPPQLKNVKSVSRIIKNTLTRAISNYKSREGIMSQTGNTGPPETDQERLLRTIVEIDYTASNVRPNVRPRQQRASTASESDVQPRQQRTSGGQERPTILDPQPIVGSSVTRILSPLSDQEREEVVQDLNLDTPVVDALTPPVVGATTPVVTYRQERRAQARDGANIRESSLSEINGRRNPPPARGASAAALAVSGVTTTIQAMSSQKSGMEAMLFHNMQVREAERERDRDERKLKEVQEKEERIRRENREERKMDLERMDKDRLNLVLFKMISGAGPSHQDVISPRIKEIKVTADVEDAGSQPLPVKIKLSTMEALKRDLMEYVKDFFDVSTEISGVVLEENGEDLILTQVDQIDISLSSWFRVKMMIKRNKHYFRLVRS